MKQFDIPQHYRSQVIGRVKEKRKLTDPRKKDFSPTVLDFGPVQFLLPRHFGFCYGVENAIEISWKAIAENPGKRIFLLSQMIHNPAVNDDLQANGIRFIMDTEGHQFIPWDEVKSDDVVIVPAFGTTIETEKLLEAKGVEIKKYNTTCPFVEKVWKRSSEIGKGGFTIIIHGKYKHEETRATFSHSYQNAPSIIIRDMKEAEQLARFVKKELPAQEFFQVFEGRYSVGFNPLVDLDRMGVVNQTTMLATETQAISDFFKQVMTSLHGDESSKHFADTRDTLCYATNDNQDATLAVLQHDADFALVVGGYNSSNTSQLVTILEQKMSVYFIKDASEIISSESIQHFNYPKQELEKTESWLPSRNTVRIVLTSGASCPDTVVDQVLNRVLELFPQSKSIEEVLLNLH
ncbi:MAG: 4-hydroxy-3-methylbut-2-enyl diphosphate reductase [Flavobacteriales bacterium]|nr:4-hydroxy-3-methylbut-2-enyl diphosphate reductase [Flavobacteriales bacterium]